MKVAIGMSGGVDSTVAALLLQEQGYDVVGVTMTLGRVNEAQSLAEARAAAERLGVQLEVFELAEEWKREVCDYLKLTYLAGSTPNPCVRCNELVKFGILPRLAFERLGCECFATGHYARTINGQLLRAVDRTKDQSYFLYRVSPEILARTIFPLGEMTKVQVREYAKGHGLEVHEKLDSQDFCGGDVLGTVTAADREGEIVDRSGKVLGHHRGYWHFTVGKRKGLGIGGGIPYFVVALDSVRNRVIVAHREDAVEYDVKLTDTVGTIDKTLPVKVRSAGEPRYLRDGIIGLAPGQSAVFYDGELVVGGGIIAASSDVG